MKVITILGARPQFIKAAPVSRALRRKHQEILVHTGQHYDANMSEIFFEELHIPRPEYHLGVGGGGHGQMTGRMLEALEEVLLKEMPDAVLVYGDTNSTLAGALAASKLLIPVLHVEAGLRSYNRDMPEEQNRIVADHLATWLSCPTRTAVENLQKEGVERGVYNTGDVMLDAVLYNERLAEQKHSLPECLKSLKTLQGGMEPGLLGAKGYDLVTVHRAENTGDPKKLEIIINALNQLEQPVLWPVHPRIRKQLDQYPLAAHICLVEPVGYLEMLLLTRNAAMVLTDSGGLQKEALFLNTPCVTLRDQTEWPETLEGGWNVLSPIDAEAIVQQAWRKVTQRPSAAVALFGDGQAAEQISNIL
jgi:UDP-N-acetylglucosamine 2-epimerase